MVAGDIQDAPLLISSLAVDYGSSGCGADDDSRALLAGLQLLGEIEARHVGHLDIGDHQTRILKTGFRAGDNAPMAYIELVDRPDAHAEQQGDLAHR